MSPADGEATLSSPLPVYRSLGTLTSPVTRANNQTSWPRTNVDSVIPSDKTMLHLAMNNVLRISTPAKLNLGLAVGEPGVDAMHPIASWMVTVDLCDELTVTRLPDDRFSRYAILWHEDARHRTDIDWSITRDLAVRAHRALEARAGRSLPVQLKLEKRIPVGAGLGGGSSDAAAMLHAVVELFDLEFGDDELRDIAHGLGSDVPFMVHGGSALVGGFGERIARVRTETPADVVLILPEASAPTARVYAAFDDTNPPDTPPLTEARRNAIAEAATNGRVDDPALVNDLTDAAVSVCPVLRDTLRDVSAIADRPARLTGSGVASFVICDDRMHAEHLARAVEDQIGVAAVAARFCGGPALKANADS